VVGNCKLVARAAVVTCVLLQDPTVIGIGGVESYGFHGQAAAHPRRASRWNKPGPATLRATSPVRERRFQPCASREVVRMLGWRRHWLPSLRGYLGHARSGLYRPGWTACRSPT